MTVLRASLTLAALILPGSALACGMYIPEEVERVAINEGGGLEEVFALIDQAPVLPAEPVVEAVPVEPPAALPFDAAALAKAMSQGIPMAAQDASADAAP